MKKLSRSLLMKTFPIAECDPNRLIEKIMDNATIRKLNVPLKAPEVCCPMCGGNRGFFIPSDNCWSCLEDECIQRNDSRNAHRPKRVSPPRPTMQMCGVPEEFYNASLEEMRSCHDQALIGNLQEYCDEMRGFLILAGKSGRGKTHASCACIAEELKKSACARFVNVTDLYLEWLNLSRCGNILDLVDRYCSPKLIVLDDLGVRKPSEAFVDFIYMIVNNRGNILDKATIISTNLDSIELQEMVGTPIASRICRGKIIKFAGDDKRQPLF